MRNNSQKKITNKTGGKNKKGGKKKNKIGETKQGDTRLVAQHC